MTDDQIALRTLLEKRSDTTFLREMIGFAAGRLMQLETETRCGAARRRASEALTASTGVTATVTVTGRRGPERSSSGAPAHG